MSEKFTCPRWITDRFLAANVDDDVWREDMTCSYCGSVPPSVFFSSVECGCEVTPTDKDYKAYVMIPDLRAGQPVQVGIDAGPAFDHEGKPNRPDLTEEECASGKYNRPIIRVAGANKRAKFYFQHLSEQEKHRFVDLLNAGTFVFAHPGHFYQLPYFCTPMRG